MVTQVLRKKKNRAGWPGFFYAELDAVPSQFGATSSEGAFLVLVTAVLKTSPLIEVNEHGATDFEG